MMLIYVTPILILHSREKLLINFKTVNEELMSPSKLKMFFYWYSSLADIKKTVSLSFK